MKATKVGKASKARSASGKPYPAASPKSLSLNFATARISVRRQMVETLRDFHSTHLHDLERIRIESRQLVISSP